MKNSKPDRVKLNIFGSNININVPGGDAAYVEELAEYVNKMMINLSEQSGAISITKVAILVAINIADEYFSEKKKREKMENDLKKILDEKNEIIKNFLKKNKKKSW